MENRIASSEEVIELCLTGKLSPEETILIENFFEEKKTFDFKPAIKRLYDLGDNSMMKESEAHLGLLGRMNKFSKWRKNNKFLKRFLSKKFDERKIIVAEGDSWFEFPIFVKDILDWIIRLSDYSVYSLASGGDWISNMIHSGDYIHELSLYKPKVFLLSGGGNDIVGNKRLALLLKDRDKVDTELDEDEILLVASYISQGIENDIARKIVVGKKFFKKEFWALLNILRFQYTLIIKNIRRSGKFEGMKIITQGYDYGIPSSNRNFFSGPIRSILRTNGKWLDQPIRMRGVDDSAEKHSIVTAMIYEFNEMLIDIGKNRENVFHIDCRGFAQRDGWFDELHYNSKHYKEVANTYIKCIRSKNDEEKVFKVNGNN